MASTTAFSMPAVPRRLPAGRSLALLVTAVNAALFVLLRPTVPDLQAALARGAAAAHGVGLTYWFGWFGGSAPGQYSLVTPWLSGVIGVPLLGALATVAVTPLVDRALAGTTHRTAGTWVATVTAGLSLWSGRIAFAVGAACAVVAICAVRERRVSGAVVAAIATAACSPVCAAFLALGMFGSWVVTRRRALVAVLVTCSVALGTIAAVFGTPGRQIFKPGTAILIVACCLVMLAARPSRPVQVVAVLTALASPVLFVIPTGMGSNLARMSYICLPVAVVATARVRRRLAVLAVVPAVAISAYGAVHDVRVGLQPAAAPSYYAGLAHRLDAIPQLRDHRLEVVQSRSYHTFTYALLGHAALATGWETQTQQELDGALRSPSLDAPTYRAWLDDHAVGYLALDRRAPAPGDPEYDLVAGGLAYLRPVWRDSTWTLYAVRRPTAIVAAPATVVQASQAQMTVRVPCACTIGLRVRWSPFLDADDARTGRSVGTVRRAAGGWSQLTVARPGTVVLRGSG